MQIVPHWTTVNHQEAERLLLEIGHARGMPVWVGMGDRHRVVSGVKLSSLCMDDVPATMPEAARRILRQVDVAWFSANGLHPVALFEVEHSTSIFTGLLRMSDVMVSLGQPSRGWQCAVVGPEARLPRFRKELDRPTFRAVGLVDVCTFISYEQLSTHWQVATSGGQSSEYPDLRP
jgi:type II restriction enzyme